MKKTVTITIRNSVYSSCKVTVKLHIIIVYCSCCVTKNVYLEIVILALRSLFTVILQLYKVLKMLINNLFLKWNALNTHADGELKNQNLFYLKCFRQNSIKWFRDKKFKVALIKIYYIKYVTTRLLTTITKVIANRSLW